MRKRAGEAKDEDRRYRLHSASRSGWRRCGKCRGNPCGGLLLASAALHAARSRPSREAPAIRTMRIGGTSWLTIMARSSRSRSFIAVDAHSRAHREHELTRLASEACSHFLARHLRPALRRRAQPERPLSLARARRRLLPHAAGGVALSRAPAAAGRRGCPRRHPGGAADPAPARAPRSRRRREPARQRRRPGPGPKTARAPVPLMRKSA